MSSVNVTFGEVSSAYFEANPDSQQKIPKIASLVPIMTPEACAKVLVRAIDSRRRTIGAPVMLTCFLDVPRLACPCAVAYRAESEDALDRRSAGLIQVSRLPEPAPQCHRACKGLHRRPWATRPAQGDMQCIRSLDTENARHGQGDRGRRLSRNATFDPDLRAPN